MLVNIIAELKPENAKLRAERDQLAGQSTAYALDVQRLQSELFDAKQQKDGYVAWLVENGKQQGQGLAYLRMGDSGMFGWTEDPYAALHFCRRADAEAVSAECEDAWRIVEHWFALASLRAELAKGGA